MGLNKRIFTDLREFENEVVEGEVNPLESWSELLELEKLITKTKSNITDTVIKEIEKLDKDYSRNGKKFYVGKKATYTYTGKIFVDLKNKISHYQELAQLKLKGEKIYKDKKGVEKPIPNTIESATVKYSEPYITLK